MLHETKSSTDKDIETIFFMHDKDNIFLLTLCTKINVYIVKKSFLLASVAIVACLSSCGNNNGNKSENNEQQEVTSTQNALTDEINQEAVKTEFDNLKIAVGKIKMAPFVSSTADGRITLTEKEKMVKPDYLINPSVVGKLATLSQKYHVVSMMAADLVVANMYEMPTVDMKEAMAKLLLDINDEAFTNFANTPWSDLEGASDALGFLVEEEYAAGRQNLFWDALAASLVEQLYIITRNVDKFMPMFTDETVEDFTFNFICLHEGLITMADTNDEMSSLHNVLEPLYAINAVSVEQFREQLKQLGGEIEKCRNYLLQ